MKYFKNIENLKPNELEKKVNDYWNSINILDSSIENRKDCKNFVFYDGPATANGMPGIHHMLAKLLKDTVCKYETMKGYKVLRKVGWDTHGLPVEVQVEKELGFSGKGDIEKYGISEFNQKCRESVWKNEAKFNEFTHKMGQFIDLDNPYITYNNDYIETEWWILKKFHDEKLIYDGLKILPYCPRCGTGLASHEVAQGYKEISVNTVTVPFQLKKMKDTYLLVWTTTPWTLIANVAACVNPHEEYVKCKVDDKFYIVAKKLAKSVLGEDFSVVETYLGSDLENLEYEQYLPILSVNKRAFYVTTADYVTMDSGTGIVHIAPAFGQDDYEVGLRYNLPVLNPVDENGCYTDGPFKGRLVVDSELEIEIIKYLASQDKIFKKQKMVHNYPHCWRCKTPLIYYSKPSLYIKTTAYKDKIIEENNKVHWHPSYVGEKRFGDWLNNMNDWAISRNRYWGTPIPLWKCSCGKEIMIGSRKELIEKSIEHIDESVELHRPYVDDIHLECPNCGSKMTRVREVIDCWFDSGSMPFAQYHYPFENKELFESQFPADFICEGVDQTRGWFYSLLVISTFVMGKSPYKNVLVNDLLLDKFGQKMHKSKGNAVEPFGILDEFGADATRFYMLYSSPVWTPLKFDEAGIREVQAKFFNTLKNTYTFFSMYANTDGVDPREFHVDYDDLEEIDQWLLSKYHHMLVHIDEAMNDYDLNKVVHYLNDFVNEDLSNWYIRRNRRRFWGSTLDNSKKSVYQTTYEVLIGVCKVLAPIAPFLSEVIYRNLTDEKSVHLADYPVIEKDKINEELETRMDLVINLISLGRNSREEAKIKVRQPIQSVLLDKKNEKIIGDMVDLIKEELNVKEVLYIEDLREYMNITYKPNFKVAGKLFGKDIKDFSKYLENIREEDIEKLSLGNLVVSLNGTEYKITEDLVEKKIESKEGYNVSVWNNLVIILNTELSQSLICEGLARETISKIQNLRKSSGFDIADRINIYYSSNDLYSMQIKDYVAFIRNETLALNMERVSEVDHIEKINDFEVGIKLEKIEEEKK
ncbi:MAG: isoleucine--tRNA ligase [Bacilli bacterium]|nr:isoleucine--tRNA ligase [Bacilli bacterium]